MYGYFKWKTNEISKNGLEMETLREKLNLLQHKIIA